MKYVKEKDEGERVRESQIENDKERRKVTDNGEKREKKKKRKMA